MPTIVFSFYGMNVDLPLAQLTWVFPVALAAVVSVVVYVYLRKSNILK